MSTSELIGSSRKLVAILEDVKTVAATDCAVLIQGETGTGKELIAQAIHEASARRQYRRVAINCAAIPAALLESELFGYERGAFTGAIASKMGRFQAADRGTLFLSTKSANWRSNCSRRFCALFKSRSSNDSGAATPLVSMCG